MTAQEWPAEFVEAPSADDEAWFLRQNGEPLDSLSWTPLNLAELEDRPPVEPTLGGLGIVYPGKRHVFSGPQESAKTIAAYIIALSVIREGQRVVLIDFEMGQWDARTRLRELGANDQDLSMIAYLEPDERPKPRDIAALVALKPGLALVDAAAGAYELQGLDDNKRGDVERFAAIYVRPFWQQGIATIILDHVVKNVETRGTYAIGSERKVGGADVHLGFQSVKAIRRGSQGVYKITTHKDRGGFLKRGKLCDFILQSAPDTHLVSWAFRHETQDEEHEFRPTHLMEKVSILVERHENGCSRNTVHEAKLGGREYVDAALDVLRKEGYLLEQEGPRRARMVFSVKAYREVEEPLPATSADFGATSAARESISLRHFGAPPTGGADVAEVTASAAEVTTSADTILTLEGDLEL